MTKKEMEKQIESLKAEILMLTLRVKSLETDRFFRNPQPVFQPPYIVTCDAEKIKVA